MLVDGTTTFNGVAYTWPGADGTSGYALVTNGSGALSWSTVSSGSGTLNYGAAGSLVYYASSGATATGTASALLTWDNTNRRLGVATTSPYATLSVSGIGVFDDYVRASYFTATSTTASSTFPMIVGSNNSGGNLFLGSTQHATKGKLLFGTSAYDEVNNRLGIGTASPGAKQQINIGSATEKGLIIIAAASQSANVFEYQSSGGGSNIFSISAGRNLQTYGSMKFGDQTSNNTWLLLGSKTGGDDAIDLNTTEFIGNRQNTSVFSGLTVGMRGTGRAAGGANITGKVIGGDFYGDVATDWYTDIVLSEIIGVRGNATNSYVEGNQTTVTKGIAVKGEGTTGDGTVNFTNVYNFYGAAHTLGTNQYGMWLEKQTGGTINSGIVLDGDGVGADIVLGDGQDAAVYYDGTDLVINPRAVGSGVVDLLYTGNTTIGGGATPTLRSNMPTGTAGVAQSGWLEIQVNGTSVWIPYWNK